MILPVGQWRRNIAYYQKLDDVALRARYDEAQRIWLQLLVDDNFNKKYTATTHSLDSLAFWQHVMECTESILKERNLI